MSGKLQRNGKHKAPNNEIYRVIAENVCDVVFVQDLDLGNVFVTASIQDEMGYSQEEALHLRPEDYLTSCGAQTVERLARKLLMKGDRTVRTEAEHICKDGSTVWREIVLRVLGTEKPAGFLMVSRDIGKRLRARRSSRERLKAVRRLEDEIVELGQYERNFRDIEIKYRTLIETMTDGLAMVDKDGIVTYVNNKFMTMLGRGKNEVIGQPIAEFLDHWNQQILKQQLVKRAKGGEDSYELEFTHKKGEKIHTVVSPKPLFDAQGNFEGSFAVVTDVNRLKAAEKALKKSQEELIAKNEQLQELNTALKVLIDKIKTDQKATEENLLRNVNNAIGPHLHKLKQTRITEKQKVLIDTIESGLRDLLSPALTRLSSEFLNLTPTEIQIAKLIAQGERTKEIATFLSLSAKTIEYHRENLREKLGLKNRRANLQAYLNSLR